MGGKKEQLCKVFFSLISAFAVGMLLGESPRIYAACWTASSCFSHQKNVDCVKCSPPNHDYCSYEYVFDAPGQYVEPGTTYEDWAHSALDQPCFTRRRCRIKEPNVLCPGEIGEDGDVKCEINLNFDPEPFKCANENILADPC